MIREGAENLGWTLEELMEELEAATRKAENSNLQKREKTGQYPADDQ